jgi:2-dehydropantoate 2-reductase
MSVVRSTNSEVDDRRDAQMKTLVVGVGVIGTIYGWALAEAGVDVTHLVRSGRGLHDGDILRLDVLDERKGHRKHNLTGYAPKLVEEVVPSDGYELVVVPTTGDRLSEALSEIVPRAGGALFLPLTSNWGGLDAIDRLLPRERYLLGYADGGGTIRGDLYWTNLGAEIHLGMVDGGSAEALRRVRSLFETAEMRPDVQDDILRWLWVHNASTVGFQAGLAKYGDYRRTLRDRKLMATCVEATRELLTLCERRGADLKKYPEVSFRGWPTWLVIAFMRVLYRTNRSMQRYTAHAASPGAMREAMANYRAMVRTAGELGVETPALDALGPTLEARAEAEDRFVRRS